jgi:hypothetical protein
MDRHARVAEIALHLYGQRHSLIRAAQKLCDQLLREQNRPEKQLSPDAKLLKCLLDKRKALRERRLD